MIRVVTWESPPVGPFLASPKSEILALKASPRAAPMRIFIRRLQPSGWTGPAAPTAPGRTLRGGGGAPPGHELVDEEELRVFPAVAEEADEKPNLPFLQALHALWADFLHGDDRPRAAPCRAEGPLVDPSLEHLPEAPFSDEGLRPEIPRDSRIIPWDLPASAPRLLAECCPMLLLLVLAALVAVVVVKVLLVLEESVQSQGEASGEKEGEKNNNSNSNSNNIIPFLLSISLNLNRR
ncbi:unnamed protein product [Spirodela intermedia]|uniref:Uncharacterized protein n=1 Tax=Spirodela intermedia TaxID=51605 RepID=A0A7I8JV40_SPIIN|nr:unnamed protein product [Spirodela intermedia]CAA6673473.1 unnamed protein product [Spirodela intermedia]